MQAVRLYGLGYAVADIQIITGMSRSRLLECCRAYHTWGITEGLQLAGIGERQISVTAGIAIDRLGQEMVLHRLTPTGHMAQSI